MQNLFDFSFDRFIAPTVAKIVYILAMVGIALSYVAFVATAFQASAAFGIFALLILGPVFAVVELIFVRILLEALLASVKTAQNTADLVRLFSGSATNAVEYPIRPPSDQMNLTAGTPVTHIPPAESHRPVVTPYAMSQTAAEPPLKPSDMEESLVALTAEASNPATTGARLSQLAHMIPATRTFVASNPATGAHLLAWLGELDDPAIDEAIRNRNAGDDAKNNEPD